MSLYVRQTLRWVRLRNIPLVVQLRHLRKETIAFVVLDVISSLAKHVDDGMEADVVLCQPTEVKKFWIRHVCNAWDEPVFEAQINFLWLMSTDLTGVLSTS